MVTESTSAIKETGSISTFLLMLPVLVLLSACADIPIGDYHTWKQAHIKKQFVLWLMSDIQPGSVEQRVDFENAVEDVNDHIEQVDLAVIAGDVLKARSKKEDFEWFFQTKQLSKIETWAIIAGNHDVRSGEIFQQYFQVPAYYGIECGSLLLLFLSDESELSSTTIGDTAFYWWEEMVKKYRHKTIITVTHGQLPGSGLLGSGVKSRLIERAERFEKILKQEYVSFWASGHTHLPQGLTGTININNKLGGTCFVNVSSIGSGPMLSSQSRFVIFTEGSDIAWVRSRNHSSHKFEKSLDYPIKLHRAFSSDDCGHISL